LGEEEGFEEEREKGIEKKKDHGGVRPGEGKIWS